MKYFLGIDTSCYTTSLAMLDIAGSLVADLRKPLEVKQGGRGLAQSEMVFQHTRNLPALWELLSSQFGVNLREITAIGVSVSPRPNPESYMPVFVVGEGSARTVAGIAGVPLYRLSHQENHILAGIRSANGPSVKRFLAIHLSGGTTEIVQVELDKHTATVELLGGSADLHAGQFIDRVGVALGLPFPAGPHLEGLAAEATAVAEIPVAIDHMTVSFSGPETHTLRLLQRGIDPASVAAGVQQCVAHSVARMIEAATAKTQLNDVLIVGGVAANQFIRQYLYENRKLRPCKLYFPENKYSSDNATGAAYFAYLHGTYQVTSA
jgi:N6-L-threonylcarbamoyladenine synthase